MSFIKRVAVRLTCVTLIRQAEVTGHVAAQVAPEYAPYQAMGPADYVPWTVEYSCVCEPLPWLAVSVDMLWMDRSTASQQEFAWAIYDDTTEGVLNTNELLFGVDGGIRVRTLYGDCDGTRLKVVYAGVWDQTARASVTYDPADIPDLTGLAYQFYGLTQTGGTSYTAEYQSDLNSLEGNWGLAQGGAIRPLVGMRWIQQNESFEIYETSAPANRAVTDVINDLVGAQTGFDVGLWNRGGWFRTEASVKAGVFRNFMRLDAQLYDDVVSDSLLRQRPDTTAYAGEITVTAIWQCTPWCALRAGYSGLWLAEIALAADQIDEPGLLTGSSPDLDGVSNQGGHFGIEAIW